MGSIGQSGLVAAKQADHVFAIRGEFASSVASDEEANLPSSLSLEIPPHTEFENAALNGNRRPAPRSAVNAGVTRGFGEYRIRVDGVVDVEVRVDRAAFANLEDSAEAQIQLV